MILFNQCCFTDFDNEIHTLFVYTVFRWFFVALDPTTLSHDMFCLCRAYVVYVFKQTLVTARTTYLVARNELSAISSNVVQEIYTSVLNTSVFKVNLMSQWSNKFSPMDTSRFLLISVYKCFPMLPGEIKIDITKQLLISRYSVILHFIWAPKFHRLLLP